MSANIPEKFLKPYDAGATEDRIYKLWEESGFFAPEARPPWADNPKTNPNYNETFSIVLPPPNVTGTLHTGHSFMLAIEDLMVRYNRMLGKKTLWIPGTDHAAIATEAVVVKQLAKEKTNKNELGREKFLERINKHAQDSHDTIVSQLKKMGSSLDWSREAFTLDNTRQSAVYTAFKKMYDDGLIYRGERIVNWDPKGQTTVSDDEVVREEETTKFYYFKYGPFTIGTARPETKFGDKYVVLHPDDTRYTAYTHGQTIELEWINGPITATVIKDEAIDMEFGTGIMTITPAHSAVDFEIAERHNLDKEQIIDKYGKLLPIAQEFEGMKIADAREKIVEKLEQKGLLEKIDENYTHQKAVSQRGGGIIEPQIMEQWWVDVNKETKNGKSLKDLMMDAVKSKKVTILPERFEKIYYHWIENLRDWNISRQIWYGHRIPVWYDLQGKVYLPREKKLIFVRHGESEGNVKKIYSGVDDSPLTDEGRKQAGKTAKSLRGRKISRIITSDLSRASETAKTIKETLGLDCALEEWPELRELDAGEFANTPADGTSIIEKAFLSEKGEQSKDFVLRAQGVWKKLRELEDQDGEVLVVAHNSFLGGLMAVYKGKTNEKDIISFRKNWHMNNAEAKELSLFTAPKGEDLKQDPDTLDTWFSSGLWTFSTLGWPEETDDLKTYHPTSVLETGHDIIFFWVARMILMSTYLLDEVPFETVYLHGMVLDKHGKKMSKSNPETAIDPLIAIEKFGADALRMAMIVGVGPGQDVSLSDDKINAYKKFANKIWNISRFVIENLLAEDGPPQAPCGGPSSADVEQIVDRQHKQYIKELGKLTDEVTDDMENYRFYLAAEKLYHYAWHTFADKIIEELKPQLAGGNEELKQSALALCSLQLATILKLLHPFMPFITEEIWQSLPHKPEKPLMVENWPTAS